MPVAAFVAVVGTAIMLFNDFGADAASQGSGSARTIAAVSRAGAIEVPSAPPARRPVSLCGQSGLSWRCRTRAMALAIIAH